MQSVAASPMRVASRRSKTPGVPPPLDVAQFHDAQLETKAFAMLLEIAGEALGVVAGSLGNDDDGVRFPALIGSKQILGDRLRINPSFGKNDAFGAAGNPGNEREVAAIASHHLDKKCALVRGSRHFDAIDCFQGHVERRIDAYGDFGRGSNTSEEETLPFCKTSTDLGNLRVQF